MTFLDVSTREKLSPNFSENSVKLKSQVLGRPTYIQQGINIKMAAYAGYKNPIEEPSIVNHLIIESIIHFEQKNKETFF